MDARSATSWFALTRSAALITQNCDVAQTVDENEGRCKVKGLLHRRGEVLRNSIAARLTPHCASGDQSCRFTKP